MLTWIGIGAQRSGTTWFTSLLLQHPECTLGRSGEKELHVLDRAVEHRSVEQVAMAYEREFDGLETAAGEWTPSYLRCSWAPELLASVGAPEVVLVVLRDPIERFHSAVRFNAQLAARRRPKRGPGFLSSRAIEAQWGSMYLPQLEMWADAIGRERMVVLQFEELVVRPERAANLAWSRMGLEPIELARVDPPERTAAADGEVALDGPLARLIEPQLEGLQSWGIDLARWERLNAALSAGSGGR